MTFVTGTRTLSAFISRAAARRCEEQHATTRGQDCLFWDRSNDGKDIQPKKCCVRAEERIPYASLAHEASYGNHMRV